MSRRRPPENAHRRSATVLRLLTTVAACLMLSLTAGVTSASAAKKFQPAARSGKLVTYRIVGVDAARVRGGYVRAGSYRRGLRAASLKRGARKHSIDIRLPRRALTRKPVLIVQLKPIRAEIRDTPATAPSGNGEVGAAPSEIRSEAVSTPPAESTTAASAPAADDSPATTTPAADTPPAAPVQAAGGDKATTRPVGSPILSDAEAASHVRRSSWEPRPANAAANKRVPLPGELDTFKRDNISIYGAHKALVTGNFTGTTDEIIQWAAWKWGLDEDILRAVAVTESYWRMSDAGDGGLSFGLTQIKVTYHAGTHPLSATSTAFNLDYYGALFRYYYEGHARWLNSEEKGEDYRSGDVWGSIGAHYAGRWHTSAAEGYISSVKKHVADRTWEKRDF